MSLPNLSGMEHSSPAASLELLRLFSETGNGEATVLLMLRHIAQKAKAPGAAVLLSPRTPKGKAVMISTSRDGLEYEIRERSNCLTFPMMRNKEELGKLYLPLQLGAADIDAFSSEYQPLLELLNMALVKWREEKLLEKQSKRHALVERRLKRQNRFLDSLYRISLDMAERKDHDRMMQATLRYAQRIMEAAFSSIYMVNERQSVLEMKYIGPNVDPSVYGIKVKLGEGGAGLAWEAGKFLVINDYPNWKNRVRLPWLDGIGTIAFVPLNFSDKIIGIICIGFTDPDRKILRSEKALLYQFANLAAIVSENVRLINGLTRKEEEFNREIHLAAEVQQAYLPFNYNDHRVQIKGLFYPLQTVSGDLFDYFWSTHGDVLFGYVADVTGHGVTAGLRTAALSVLFREAAELALPLVDKMKWVHGRSLGYFSEGAYFAAICFELDFRQGELRVACGGLYEFFAKTRYYIGKIEMSGSLMGLKRTPSFEERTYPARKGDCFYFLTDGFNELIESDTFPKLDFQETCRCLEMLKHSDAAWDDMAGLCIQLKPDKIFLPGNRPDLQVYFIGFAEYHAARLQMTAFIERNYPVEADDILLAFHEAAGNALRHGSDKKPIFIRLRDFPGYVSIRVRDSGAGFDSQSYLKNKEFGLDMLEDGLLACSGRGIGIMRECVDRVCYSRLGNEVLLIKKLDRQNQK